MRVFIRCIKRLLDLAEHWSDFWYCENVERSGIEVFGQETFGISKRGRKKRNSRAKMRLKVGFSFPPVILAYALQCKR